MERFGPIGMFGRAPVIQGPEGRRPSDPSRPCLLAPLWVTVNFRTQILSVLVSICEFSVKIIDLNDKELTIFTSTKTLMKLVYKCYYSLICIFTKIINS